MDGYTILLSVSVFFLFFALGMKLVAPRRYNKKGRFYSLY